MKRRRTAAQKSFIATRYKNSDLVTYLINQLQIMSILFWQCNVLFILTCASYLHNIYHFAIDYIYHHVLNKLIAFDRALHFL